MSSLAGKIRDTYARGGLREIARSAWQGLLARSVHRLDYWLFYRHKWATVRPELLHPAFYYFFKLAGFTEAEHQIGRLLHMREVLRIIAREKLTGDLVEFGTYQGFSLSWLARFRDELGLTMRIVGIDSFQGLPESSTVWKKGLFSDTTRNECENNIRRSLKIRNLSDANIFLIAGLFNDSRVARELATLTSRVRVSHIDCDLGSSCTQALSLLQQAGAASPLFLLFDDWYWHPDEIPLSFFSFLLSSKYVYKEREISSTRFTRYVEIRASSAREIET